MIRFTCPKCRALLAADEQQAGSKFACADCGQLMLVPVPAAVKPAGAAGAGSPADVPAADGAGAVLFWTCPHCRAGLNVPLDRVGRSQPCPECHETIQVPDPRTNHRQPTVVAGPAPPRPRWLFGLLTSVAVVGLLAAAAVVLLVWRPWSGPTAPSAAQLAFLPDDTQFVAALNVEQLQASAAYRKIKTALVHWKGKDSFQDNEAALRRQLGLGLSDVAHVLLGGKFGGDAPVELVAVVKTKTPISPATILKSESGKGFKGREAKVGPYTLYRGLDFLRVPSFCVVDDTTLVVGYPEPALRRVLVRDRRPHFAPDVQTALAQADFGRTFTAALGKVSADLQGALRKSVGFREDHPLAFLLQQCDGMVLEIDAGAEIAVRSVVICPDAEAARKVKESGEAAVTLTRNVPGVLPPSALEFLDRVRFRARGRQAVVTIVLDPDRIIPLIEARGGP